jgi:uncharacterized protein
MMHYMARSPANDRERQLEPAAVVGALLERLDAGDLAGVAALFAAEVDWYVPGPDELPWTGRRTRRAQVADWFVTLLSQFEPETSSATADRVLADEHGAAIFTTVERTFASSGVRFTNPIAMLLEVTGGEIVKMHLYEDTHTLASAYHG